MRNQRYFQGWGLIEVFSVGEGPAFAFEPFTACDQTQKNKKEPKDQPAPDSSFTLSNGALSDSMVCVMINIMRTLILF